jgi:hypothetical protein
MPHDFLYELFNGYDGYVYVPIKNRKWIQNFFQWPTQLPELVDFIMQNAPTSEVYISPSLFHEPRVSQDSFKGTQFLWAEFDGSTPQKEVIEPTFKIQSSTPGHEHWYWKLDEFVTDRVVIEEFTRRIAYSYGADLSGWDYQQVLRPPNTYNHKRSKPVTVLSKSRNIYSIRQFDILPRPPAAVRTDISTVNLPPRDIILAKYKWSYDALDIISKDDFTGDRSDALARLAHECVEMGLSNEEIYVLVDERARKWGKFAQRTDREHRLKGLISFIRSKHIIEKETVQEAPVVFRFLDFMNTDVRLEWIVKGLLPQAGSSVIFGSPGIGKSTFALRLGMAIANGSDNYLSWTIEKRQRVLFISLEMQHDELKQFFLEMELGESEAQNINEWFHIWPVGHAYPFDSKDQQIELLQYIDQFDIQLVIIDSLSLAMYGSIKDDDVVKKFQSFFNEDLRKDRRCGYMFIHHPRKAIDRERKLHEQDDVFGSSFIVFNTQTIIAMEHPKGLNNNLHIRLLKHRMTEGEGTEFTIRRTPNRDFEVINASKAGNRQTPTNGGGSQKPSEMGGGV